MPSKGRLFPALLRYWRNHRGMSQLDLGLSADVSARHVSFLETGRAVPSRDMVLRLAAALRVPLRDSNTMLHAAGFEELFAEPSLQGGLSPAVHQAIERMLLQHEPFPMVIMDRGYNVQRMNHGAACVLPHFIAELDALAPDSNVFELLFDPRLARHFVVDWARTARNLLSRLHLEALEHPNDGQLETLIEKLLDYPDVPADFRQPDFSVQHDPAFTLQLCRDGLTVGFLTTLTIFTAPGNVTLDELRIESYFPVDAATAELCARLTRP